MSFSAYRGTVLHNTILRNFVLNCTGFLFFIFGEKPFRTGIRYGTPGSVLPIPLKISSPILQLSADYSQQKDPVYLPLALTSAFVSIRNLPHHVHTRTRAALLSLPFKVLCHWYVPRQRMPFSPLSIIAKVNNYKL